MGKQELTPPSCRLFVILARDVPLGVILRRGPTSWYHLILWHTREDTFQHGAWFRGRIYEEKCDLSPDGTLFVYFVHKGNRVVTSYTCAWTAISRPPWLYALILWPQGDARAGGGRFVSNRRLAHHGLFGPPHPDHPLRGVEVINDGAEFQASTGEVAASDWCGRDHDGKVIYTVGSKLFRRSAEQEVEIADFSALRPKPEPAPEWARQPL